MKSQAGGGAAGAAAGAAGAGALALGEGEGAAVSPDTAWILRDRELFAAAHDIELVEDQFDQFDRDYDCEEEGEGEAEAAEGRECALCHREGNCDPVPGLADLYPVKEARQGEHGHLIDPRGTWMSAYPLMLGKNRTGWVHRLCALFCPRACIEGSHRWFNVAKEVRVSCVGALHRRGRRNRSMDPDNPTTNSITAQPTNQPTNHPAQVIRGRALKCTVCDRRGATVGCTARANCPVNCHFPCAVEAHGWLPAKMGVGVSPFVCRGGSQTNGSAADHHSVLTSINIRPPSVHFRPPRGGGRAGRRERAGAEGGPEQGAGGAGRALRPSACSCGGGSGSGSGGSGSGRAATGRRRAPALSLPNLGGGRRRSVLPRAGPGAAAAQGLLRLQGRLRGPGDVRVPPPGAYDVLHCMPHYMTLHYIT